jgi:hypothetical protein
MKSPDQGSFMDKRHFASKSFYLNRLVQLVLSLEMFGFRSVNRALKLGPHSFDAFSKRDLSPPEKDRNGFLSRQE